MRIEALSKVRRVGIDTLQRPAEQDGPALLMDGVDPVDLERDVERRAIDHVAGPCPQRDPGSFAGLDQPVVHGEHNRPVVAGERDAPNRARTQQREAFLKRELVKPGFRHHIPRSS
jgi:hypothetical protein